MASEQECKDIKTSLENIEAQLKPLNEMLKVFQEVKTWTIRAALLVVLTGNTGVELGKGIVKLIFKQEINAEIESLK